MDDLISRQAAIDDLQDKDPSQIWDTADIEVWINALPSTQPERKTGRWIHKHERTPKTWECSNCGYRVNLVDGGIYKFCSACGELKEGEG